MSVKLFRIIYESIFSGAFYFYYIGCVFWIVEFSFSGFSKAQCEK